MEALLGGHNSYVNSLAYIPSVDGDDGKITHIFTVDIPSDVMIIGIGSNPDRIEYIASGGNSALILLHSLKTLSQESKHALLGHQLNVSTLHYSSKRRKLFSGSWDKTARIWSKEESGWECETVLEGHEEAVWGVLGIDKGPQEGGWLTASGMPSLTVIIQTVAQINDQ